MGNVFRYYNYKALAHILALQIILKKISTVFFWYIRTISGAARVTPKERGEGGEDRWSGSDGKKFFQLGNLTIFMCRLENAAIVLRLIDYL